METAQAKQEILAEQLVHGLNRLSSFSGEGEQAERPAQGDSPLYRQISDKIRYLIEEGDLPDGAKLPTVRELADALNLSRGTIKHAYNTLADEGFLTLRQGRGTFVDFPLVPEEPLPSRKDRAMEAIDGMLAELRELGFSRREIQIFLELKLREHDEHLSDLKVAVFTESPEERTVILNELSTIPGVELFAYPAEDLFNGNVDTEMMDLLVTTEKPYFSLMKNPLRETREKLSLLGLTLHPQTLIDLSRLEADRTVGVLSLSKTYSGKMLEQCESYAVLNQIPRVCLFQQRDLQDFLQQCDTVIVPMEYMSYMTDEIQTAWKRYQRSGREVIYFRTTCEKSSLLSLRLRMEEMFESRQKHTSV